MTEEEYQRGAAHDAAFLVPIPYYYAPVWAYYGGVGCAAGVGEFYLLLVFCSDC